jgi:hypothetical protein
MISTAESGVLEFEVFATPCCAYRIQGLRTEALCFVIGHGAAVLGEVSAGVRPVREGVSGELLSTVGCSLNGWMVFRPYCLIQSIGQRMEGLD